MKDYSQNGESKILHELFKVLNIDKGFFVDIGAGDGFELSNTRYFKELGWDGIMYDMKGKNDVVKMRITRENVCGLIPDLFNLLSIDIDGNDFWILNEILAHRRPDVVCFEINSEIRQDVPLAMPYNPDHTWDGTNAFGMNYLAGFHLMLKHKYEVFQCVNNTNLIAIKLESRLNLARRVSMECGMTKSHPEKMISWENVSQENIP